MSEMFSEQAMLGYAYAAYCAGWKSAVKACTGNPTGCGEVYDWLKENPPPHVSEPLWAFDRPPLAKAMETGTAKTERLGAKHDSAGRKALSERSDHE